MGTAAEKSQQCQEAGRELGQTLPTSPPRRHHHQQLVGPGPGLEWGLLIPNRLAAFLAPQGLCLRLQVPGTRLHLACRVLFLNCPICAGSVVPTRLRSPPLSLPARSHPILTSWPAQWPVLGLAQRDGVCNPVLPSPGCRSEPAASLRKHLCWSPTQRT